MASHKDRILLQTGKEIEGYVVRGLLGQGGFGDVYKVTNSANDISYAMKTEYLAAPKRALSIEIGILEKLTGKCFPKLYCSGETSEVKYLVMDMFGPSLADVRRKHLNSLSMAYIFQFSCQMLKVIEKFHQAGFVHRDIKPSNFLIQHDQEAPLVLIDFGLSKAYIDFHTRELLPPTNGHYIGTKKYASVNSHSKLDLGRRDDLISWFYAVLEMLRGRLPWRNLKDTEAVARCKGSEIENLLKPFPVMVKIYNYLIGLSFEDEPDYDHILQFLYTEMESRAIRTDRFDWLQFFDDETKKKEEEEEEEIAENNNAKNNKNENKDKKETKGKKKNNKKEDDESDEKEGNCCLIE